VLVGLLAFAGAPRAARSPSIELSKPMPSGVRVGDRLTLVGRARDVPQRARAALESLNAGRWQVLVEVRLHNRGAFRLRWRVPGPPYRELTLRVAALRRGALLAASTSTRYVVGPQAVYCAPAAPPQSVPAGDGWIETGLVFTTRHGTPIEPRNFNRSFDRRIARAGVPKITVHGARKTCGSLLAALDVHPRVAPRPLGQHEGAVDGRGARHQFLIDGAQWEQQHDLVESSPTRGLHQRRVTARERVE